MLRTGLVVELARLSEPAKGHRRGEWRHDQPATQPRGQFDRRLGERRDIRRCRPLHRPRRDQHILERIEPAAMRDRRSSDHSRRTTSMPSSKIAWLSSNDTPSGAYCVLVIAAARGEIDAAAAQQIEGRPLFGDPDRMMQRQHRHRRGQPDALRCAAIYASARSGQDSTRACRNDARRSRPKCIPAGPHKRLVDDVRDQPVRRAQIAVVMIVTQREVTEFMTDPRRCHRPPSTIGRVRARRKGRLRRPDAPSPTGKSPGTRSWTFISLNSRPDVTSAIAGGYTLGANVPPVLCCVEATSIEPCRFGRDSA